MPNKPPVKQPPVSPDAKPVKGEKGKGKGKGKKGKSKGKDFGSPRSRPGKPSEPVSPPTQSSRMFWLNSRRRVLESPRGPKSGLSQADPRKYRCDFCRKRGHLSRNCPEITFRVSLSEGAMIPKKAHEEDVPQEPEVLVTAADPETWPDAAIRLVERRAVRANLKEEKERLKQHEAEANEILRREKERKDRERKGQDHEVSEKEKKFLARDARKKNTKEKKKKVLKDKKIVKDKKTAVKDEKEKEKPVAEEYSYYSTSEDPQAKVKPAPKADDGKRKAKAMPKLAVKKARGRPKNEPPTPPSSPSSESGDQEGEEEDLLTDDFPPECEESTSPSQESEVFEADSAVPRRAGVQAKKRPDSLPDPKQKPPKRLADDKAEMDRLREESRKLEQAQREVEAERAQLRAELRAKKARKKAEEAEKDPEAIKKAAKEKEKEEKKELRRQAELELRKEDEARVADLRKGQTGGSAAIYPEDELSERSSSRSGIRRLLITKLS